MEDSHADYEEWQGTNEREEIVPEMGSYQLASSCDIGCNHSCHYDSDAIEYHDAPIWQCSLRKIPIRQFVYKKGYIELIQHP